MLKNQTIERKNKQIIKIIYIAVLLIKYIAYLLLFYFTSSTTPRRRKGIRRIVKFQ